MQVVVCGSGTMGSGIAQVIATAGFSTILYDVNKAAIQKAEKNILASLEKTLSKNIISPVQYQMALNNIQYVYDVNYCTGDIVFEAIVEKYEAKANLFNQLAELNHSETIFATNTSSLSITALQQQIQNPARVIGVHFFNPPVFMKLVEVVKGKQTADKVVNIILPLIEQCGKKTVLCNDAPGFIVNRVARPYYIEALRLHEKGVLVEDIDMIMQSCGFKMGPFALMDLIGNDINYAVSESVYEQLGKPERLKPSYIQKEKVEEGKLGKKTNEGYYTY
jgi:3-hydroxybutyryl-CoA dehydrogenase